MLQVRNILYFTPFYFRNGNAAKNKYFVVLSILEKQVVIASLPTSKDHIPYISNHKDGCIEIPEANLNCFVITTETCVTECGKHFPVNTFLYGHLIQKYEIDYLNELYLFENIDYQIWGKMTEQLFRKMINCFKNSKSVKRKYKTILSSHQNKPQ